MKVRSDAANKDNYTETSFYKSGTILVPHGEVGTAGVLSKFKLMCPLWSPSTWPSTPSCLSVALLLCLHLRETPKGSGSLMQLSRPLCVPSPPGPADPHVHLLPTLSFKTPLG